jgi:PAS domain S-box-containing protein
MTQTPHDPGADLRATIEALYSRVLEMCFDPETGALRDREAAEQLIYVGEKLAGMERTALLNLRMFPDDLSSGAPAGRAGLPARARRLEGEELVILRGIADTAGHGFAVTDLQGVVVYANPALLSLMGLPDLGALQGKSISPFYREPINGALRQEVVASVMEKGQWVGELDLRSTSGESIATLHSLFLLHGELGREPYIGGLIIDIRRQKEAVEALRASEENFRALAENASEGILIATRAGEHVYANARAAELTGYSIAELLRLNMRQLAHPDETERLTRIFRRRLETGTGPRSYPTRIVRKDGREVHVEVTGALTDWHGQPADIVMIRDITRRQQIELALRESEERYSLVVEEGCDGVAIAQDEVIIYASRPMGRLLGYRPEELVGRHFFELMPPEDREAARASHLARLAGAAKSAHGRVRLILSDGGVGQFDFYGARIQYRGRPALMGIIRSPVPCGDSTRAGENGEGA